ncbi:MAG: hypothetical protein GTN73_06135 [Candidatus Aminicenantes bacterium]|nr:hypothetical protein [Candidatus Aminicenantes bacterium]
MLIVNIDRSHTQKLVQSKMKEKSRPAELYIRLPGEKKGIKRELGKIAAKNDITLNRLIIFIIDWFLEQRKDKEFVIKLK